MDRLLFVDDEPMVLSALRRTFVTAGFDVVTANGPTEGLARLQDSGPFELVCSDYRMPGMTGIEFLRCVQTLDPKAFRVLLTAVEEFSVAVEAINSGEVHRYLSKPWDPREFVMIAREACERRRLERCFDDLTGLLHEKNRELERLNGDLERLVNERTTSILEGLTCALENRDAETQWHSRRVTQYTLLMARRLELQGQDLVDLEHGALLHDIGKIGVRDAILLKNGPLTPDEWSEMKRHPALGYELLRNIPHLKQARVILLQHHERWDGRGYPQQLREKKITIGARILSVADTYDALTSDRPYRKGRTYEVAREEIVRCSGSQFDPDAVNAFTSLPPSAFEDIRAAVHRLEKEDARRVAEEAIETMGADPGSDLRRVG